MTALSNQITKAIVAISKANALMSVGMDASEIKLLLKLKKQTRKLREHSAMLDLATMRAKDVALKYKLSLNKVIAMEQYNRLYNVDIYPSLKEGDSCTRVQGFLFHRGA